MEEKFSKMRKKGVSGVVATVIMIALVLAVVAIVWGVVSNLVSEQLEEAGSCFGIFGKISLDNTYTCYNAEDNEMVFGVNIADINVSSVIVMVSVGGSTKSYTITNEEKSMVGVLENYGGGTDIKLPGKNGGSSYNASNIDSRPDSIRIAPVIGGNQCEVSDSISNIQSCSLTA